MEDLFNEQQTETVAQSQGQQNEDFAQPQEAQDANYDMSDDEFSEYTESILNGTEPEEDEEEDEGRSAAGVAKNSDIKSEADENVSSEDEDKNAKAAQPYKSFETQEEYQSFMDKVIGERIKNTKAKQEKYEGFGRRAMGSYGGEDEQEALERLLDDAEEQAALSSGKSREEYLKEQSYRQDALMYRRQIAEKEARENALKAIQDRWLEEEAQLKAVIPDFDLTRAMQNPEFKALVTKGVSVSAAYIKLTSRPKPQERQTISEIGARTGQVSSKGATDYQDLSDEEFMRRMDKIRGKS